jgi:Metallo-peptidase family M12B Reprolysin-like
VASVRSILSCLDVQPAGSVSLLFHLWGFGRAKVPTDPDTSVTASVSLLQKIRGAQGDHIHLNVIRVGFDSIPAGNLDQAEEKLDYAIYKIHNVYRPVSLGIGRVTHWVISTAEADGADDLGSEDEADELSDDWSVPGDGIDVFVVRNISDSDFVGISPVDGDCDEDSKDDGLVGGEIGRNFDPVARTFAHEIGHFLGLEHNHDDDECPTTTAGKNNLMAQTKCAISVRDSVLLTGGQGSTMRDHCSVRGGC